MSEQVQAYYDKIATEYDSSRFSNTYGKFIDRQERRFLYKHLPKEGLSLNLGCGTGRFMEYTTHGLDFSSEMLNQARKRFPDKEYTLSSADQTPYADNTFDSIICFHVIMHLTKEKTEAILEEAFRILKPNGTLILDFPSQERRKLTKYKAENWHGANGYSKQEFTDLTDANWKMLKTKGVLFFPVHRIPKFMRSLTYPFDQMATKSPFKHYSSYLIAALKKKA